MRVEIEALQRIGEGYCLRFRGDDFVEMRERIRALSMTERSWMPEAFHERGGWWLSQWAFERLGPLFQNYALMCARLEVGEVGASTARSSVPPEVECAFQALHLRSTAPVWAIQAIYRVLAKRTHPDTGGSEAEMKAINAAYETARTWAENHKREKVTAL